MHVEFDIIMFKKDGDSYGFLSDRPYFFDMLCRIVHASVKEAGAVVWCGGRLGGVARAGAAAGARLRPAGAGAG